SVYRKLLDSETCPAQDIPIAAWRSVGAGVTSDSSASVPVLLTSSAPGTVRLVLRYWTAAGGAFIEDSVSQRITSVNPMMMPDVDGDRSLGDGDVAGHLVGRVFRFWTNEDCHKGDYVGQSSDTSPNSSDLVVNGRLDLVNLFPVKLDLKPLVDAWGNGVRFMLWSPQGSSLRFCGLDSQPSGAWAFQTNDVYTTGGDPVHSADLIPVGGEGVEIDPADYLGFGNSPGVLAFEAAGEVMRPDALMLLVMDGDDVLFSYSLPLSVRSVRDMYSWIGARHLSGETDYRSTVVHRMWEGETVKSLIFFHGANVTGPGAQEWADSVFKRLWLSGAKMEFYNVDWRSDIGSDANYHQNASNAFVVASQLASTIAAIPGEKVVMAHSLGNMVVSSMIQDYGLQVSKYLMCNSAVPAEAYDRSMSLRTPKLVHPDWEEYPTNSWTASWHALFKDDLNDDRKYLGWPGRFTNVLNKAVNFYSTSDHGGDEVLELAVDNDVGILTGITSSLAHHSWHKQELFKGRGLGVGAGATDWSGWNIEEDWLGVNKISVERALDMDDADFKTNTVFYCYPSSMNSANINLLVRGAHLALGIPALVAATGVTDLSDILDQENSFNLDLANPGIEHPNGWPGRSSYPNRWLHSDVKDVSYFFNFKFYEKAIEKGCLK
ncbi:MAG: alpha/beta hydrolase, partial [Kiritimatiellae bacterium]|nr:alpha/beta hydrolase [Kiritimatiellia bacterium]